MERDKTVGDTFSPASKYEAMLVERGGVGLTEEKAVLVFQVLDQVIPHLGVFTQVMKICRDELLEAVFSEQYTGSEKRYIQRIPYFVLVRRLYTDRDENADQLVQQLEVVKKRLFERQKQYDSSCQKVESLENQLQEAQSTIKDLREALAATNKHIESLQNTLEADRQQALHNETELKHDIEDFKEDLQEARTEAQFLRQYKVGYDDLQQAFNEPFKEHTDLVAPKRKKKATMSTKRANLISSIENAVKLDEQLLTVQNFSLEEFDKFLEDHKMELSSNGEQHGFNDNFHDDLEQADEQLMAVQERFKKSIDDINNELVLLRQHRTMLQEQLQILDDTKPAVTRKKKVKSRASRPATQESAVSSDGRDGTHDVGIEEIDEEPSDPFIPQERIFAKYAAMIYTSDNNGKNFHEFKDAKYCPSCLDKTVLCPHKILQQEHIFVLPPNSTHLKITRPKVKISLEILDAFRPLTSHFSEAPVESFSAAASPSVKHLRGRMSLAAQVSPYHYQAETPENIEAYSSNNTPIDTTHFTHTIERLWDDYKNRTTLDRVVPRPLSLNRALSLVEQFCAYLIWGDDNNGTDSYCHILDQFYRFLSERYLKPDITFFAAHDFLCALMEYTNTNKMVWMFGSVLIGNLDAAVLRYILVMNDFIAAVNWQHVEDFRPFAQVIYPFLNDDDLDTLQMGYTSFSENKVSPILVCEYLLYNVRKYREPRFLEMENKLLNTPGKEHSLMTENEFIDSSDSVLTLVNDNFRKKLYQEALLFVKEKDKMVGGVPVIKLAQIASYLELLQIQNVVKNTLTATVSKAQAQRDPSMAGAQTVPTVYTLIAMTNVKTLASNIAERNNLRLERLSAN